MADGSWQVAGRRLGEALATNARLQARCRCGARAGIDPAPWIAQGLAGQPLHVLEDRLRCRCGARRARLEIVLRSAVLESRTIYPFR